MKINYSMVSTVCTGGARVIFEIANGLIERGHEVTITACFGKGTEHEWFPLKAEAHYVNKLLVRTANYALKRLLKREMDLLKPMASAIPDCDVNVATYCLTALPVYRSGKGVPFYHMQHYEPLFFEDVYTQKMAEETYYLPLNKIANSIWLKNLMKEKFGFDLPIVNPGIDLNTFHPREAEKTTDRKRILCYGTLKHRWKGFPEALKAMEIVLKQRSDVEFIVYGPRPLSYQGPKVPFKFIHFPSDDELAKLYSSADVVINPSWHESFPLPPLEAMACGAPVVTTRYGTEDYTFHEENALVVPPRDPQKMAEAVLKVLSDVDLADKLRRKGIETAKEFTWSKTIDRVESIFRNSTASNSVSISPLACEHLK